MVNLEFNFATTTFQEKILAHVRSPNKRPNRRRFIKVLGLH